MKKYLLIPLLLLGSLLHAQSPAALKALILSKLTPTSVSDRITALKMKDVANAMADQIIQLDSTRGTSMSISRLRSLTTTASSLPKLITVEDAQKTGVFLLDKGDTTTPDNGGSVLVTSSLGRYKRVERVLTPPMFGAKADSSTDDTPALQAWLNAVAATPGKSAFLTKGTYRTTYPLVLPDGVTLDGDRAARLIVSANFLAVFVDGNDGTYVLRAGSNCLIQNLKIDCRGYNPGPVLILNRQYTTVKDCQFRNWHGAHFGTGVIASLYVQVLNNAYQNGDHAIHAYKSDFSIFSGNQGDVMFSGIYTGWTKRCLVENNTIKNCADVGFDGEGGEYTLFMSNYAERCKNGELAIFSGNNEDSYAAHHIIFLNNIVHRKATYVTSYNTNGTENTAACDATYGACSFWSLDEGQYESGFENNHLTVDFGLALYHFQVVDKTGRQVFFRGNHIQSSAGFFNAYNSDGLHIENNTFEGLPGSEGIENFLRDGHGLVLENNVFRYANAKTTTYCVNLLTISGFATAPPSVSSNRFYNTNTRAFQVDLFNNGSLKPVLFDNTFSVDYVSNGGLNITTNGPAVLRDQKLRILLSSGTTDLNTTVPALADSKGGPNKAFGNLIFGRGAYNGLGCTVAWLSGTGIFVSSLNTISGLTASGSGANITLTDGTGVTNKGYLDLTLNSFFP